MPGKAIPYLCRRWGPAGHMRHTAPEGCLSQLPPFSGNRGWTSGECQSGQENAVSAANLQPYLSQLAGQELCGRQRCETHIKLYCHARWAGAGASSLPLPGRQTVKCQAAAYLRECMIMHGGVSPFGCAVPLPAWPIPSQ